MTSFWDFSAKIFGWLLVATIVLTVLFIMLFGYNDGILGGLLAVIISIFYILPFAILLGIGYGVSTYMKPKELVEVGDPAMVEVGDD